MNSKHKYKGITLIVACLTSVLIAALITALNIWIGTDNSYRFAVANLAVALAVKVTVEKRSIFGAIVGALACGFSFFCYRLFLEILGYYIENSDSTGFYVGIIVCMIIGASIGYNREIQE